MSTFSASSVTSGVTSLLFLVMPSYIFVIWYSQLDSGHCPGQHMKLGSGLTYISDLED